MISGPTACGSVARRVGIITVFQRNVKRSFSSIHTMACEAHRSIDQRDARTGRSAARHTRFTHSHTKDSI